MGYVLRVSEANAYESPWHILRLAGVEQREMRSAAFPIERLAEILGRPPESLEHIAYQQAGDGLMFKILGHELGHALSAAPLRIEQPALCPHCVEESGHIDAFWDLRSAVACPTHGCRVLQTCPHCGNELGWFRPGLLTCRCGASLANVSLPAVEQPLAELMGVIKATLDGQPLSSLPNSAGFPLEHLEGITLSALLWLLDKMGHLNIESKGLPAAGIGKGVEAAVEPLANWPTGYHEFLTRLGHRNLADTPAAGGLRKQFEAFYNVLFKNSLHAAASGFLRDEFVAFGLNTWGNGIVNKKLLREARPATGRFISKTEFARQHGIWKPTMERMIADGTIVTKVITAGRVARTLVNLEHTRIPAESAGIVTVREAAEHLGIPVSVLDGLRGSGVFVTKLRVGRERSWHVDDVEAFLARGLALATSDENVCTQDSIALADVMRVKLRDAAAKTDIVAALFDGRLPVVGLQGSDLGGLLLEKVALDRFILNKRRTVEGNTFSFQETARMSGLDPMVVDDALHQGLISGVERDGRRRVPAASVERFNAEYVVLRAVASSLGVDIRQLANVGRNAGVPLVELRRASGLSQPVLARRDEPVLRAAWHDEADRIASRASLEEQMAEKRLSYEAALQRYLDDLRATGEQLPRVSGRTNKVGIAKACDFGRDVLYNFPTVVAMLEAYDREERERLGGGHRTAHDAVKAYLDTLAIEGRSVPRSASGQVNKLAVAKACDIHRNVLYNRPELMALLESHPL